MKLRNPTLSVTFTTPDQLEEVAAGGSGLQNLGDGYYQLNSGFRTAQRRV